MNVAIIGTGAAGLGATLGVLDRAPDANLTFFDVPGDLTEPQFSSLPPRDWPVGAMRDMIDRGRAGHRRSLMPQRSHFGNTIPQKTVGTNHRLYHGHNPGGLTRFWSAGMYNLAPGEFAAWPVDFKEMAPYYHRIASMVGVSGAADPLDRYFQLDYVNRPAINRHPALEQLAAALNAKNDPYMVAGANRLSIETAEGHPRGCVACGECLTGCFRGSILYAPDALNGLLADKKVTRVRDRIRRIERVGGRNRIVGTTESHAGFDHVFLAAGCLGSAEITLRSLGLRHTEVPLYDNPMYLFPVFRPLSNPFKGGHGHVAISNHTVAFLPRTPDESFVHAFLTPVPDLMLRNILPKSLWRVVGPLGQGLRNATAVVKIYLGGAHAHRYALALGDDDELHVRHVYSPDAAEARAWSRHRFKSALAGTGWLSAFTPFIDAATSAHYAGPLAYGNETVPVDRTGTIMPGVHVCDSAVFPETPAQPLTFTIMANALRTAEEVLDG